MSIAKLSVIDVQVKRVDQGIFFCEAVKVDMGASKDKKQQKHLSSTISLLQVLFEDLGLATSLCNESADGIPHVQILKPEIHLFNTANDD